MKTMILSFVLASIAGFMYCSDESLAGFARRGQQCRTCCPVIMESSAETPAVVQEPEDLELRALQESRRDTLKKVVAILDQSFQSGVITVNEVLKEKLPLLEAELELARSQQERIAIFEKMLEAQTDAERNLDAIVAQGGRAVGGGVFGGRAGVGPADLLIATAARIKAEIELYKAKKGI